MKRKYLTTEEKHSFLHKGDANGVTITCRERGIANSPYYSWRGILRQPGHERLAGKLKAPGHYDLDLTQLKDDHALLKRSLAKKEMELSLAKDYI